MFTHLLFITLFGVGAGTVLTLDTHQQGMHSVTGERIRCERMGADLVRCQANGMVCYEETMDQGVEYVCWEEL